MDFCTKVSADKIEVSTSKEQPADHYTKDTIPPPDMSYELVILNDIVDSLTYFGMVSTSIDTSTKFVHDFGGRRNVTSSTLVITIEKKYFEGYLVWLLILKRINETLRSIGVSNYISFPAD